MPQVIIVSARLRLYLDHVGAKIGQDHRSARTGNEARQIHHLQSGKNIVACHGCSSLILVRGRFLYRPWNWGGRFSRNADVPSFLSSVAAQRPKYAASSSRPSSWPVSSPLLTASSESLTAVGALAPIFFRMASARAMRFAAGTISLTSPMR